MAFTVTARHTGNTSATSAQTLASGSTTPTANSLLLVGSHGQGDGDFSNNPSIGTPTGGSLSYTLCAKAGESPQFPFGVTLTQFDTSGAVFRADVGASPSAFAATVDHYSATTTLAFYSIKAVDVTGHTSSTPVQTKANGASGGSAGNGGSSEVGTVTLDAAPTSGNLLLVWLMRASDDATAPAAPTAGAGKTMTAAFSNEATTQAFSNVWYRTCDGTESATITSSDLGQLVGAWVMIAVEIAGAGGGGGGVVNGPQVLRPGFMTGNAFPAFLDAAPHAGWSPVDAAYDIGPTTARSGTASLDLSASGAAVSTGVATASLSLTASGVTAPLTYFTNIGGATPQLLVSAEDWGVLANGGLNHGGDFAATYDDYFSTRQAQGYNGVLVSVFSFTGLSGGANGPDSDGTYPFNTNSTNPNNAANTTFWGRRDTFLSTAATYGFRVFLNVTTPFLNAGTFTASWTNSQWTAFGNFLGARYASQSNIMWMVGDDYFDSIDSGLDALLAALRAQGANQPISIENYQETSSRKDIFNAGTRPWGNTNAQYNFGYSYNVSYDVVEKMGLETNPLPYYWADGFFLASGSTGITDVNLTRRMVWWALSSGSKGFQVGDNDVWVWASSSLAQLTSKSFYTSQVPAIASYFRNLPNWQELKADTSSLLVTAGRGTHTTAIQSGGSGTPYTSNSDSYVTASYIQAGSNAGKLAVIYMSHASTITIDESKMVAGYTATWVDPASGATSAATPGTSYNSGSKGTNSVGDADWVLVLSETTLTGTASLSLSGSGAAKGVGTGSASLSLSASGAGSGQASGSASLSLSGAGVHSSVGTASLSLSGSGQASVAGSATASLSLSGAGVHSSVGAASLSLSGAGSAAGVVTATAALSLSGAGVHSSVGSASLTLAGSGAASAPIIASASLALTGSAVHSSQATGSLTLAGSGSTSSPTDATGSLTLSASGQTSVPVSATGSLSLSASGNASVTGSASASLDLSASAGADTQVFVDDFEGSTLFTDVFDATISYVNDPVSGSQSLLVTNNVPGDFGEIAYLTSPVAVVPGVYEFVFWAKSVVDTDELELFIGTATVGGGGGPPVSEPIVLTDEWAQHRVQVEILPGYVLNYWELWTLAGTQWAVDDFRVTRLGVAGSGVGTASLSLSASGAVGAVGTAFLDLSASGAVSSSATASASLDLAATGSAVSTGVGSASLSLSGSGDVRAPVSASASLTLSATGVAGYAISGSAALTVSATGAAGADTSASASLSITGAGVHSSVGAASLDLSGSGAAQVDATASASLTLSAAGVLANGPTGLTVTPLSDTSLLLDWDDYGGAIFYEIERGGSVLTTVSSSTFTDTGLSPGTQYCYRVRAVT